MKNAALILLFHLLPFIPQIAAQEMKTLPLFEQGYIYFNPAVLEADSMQILGISQHDIGSGKLAFNNFFHFLSFGLKLNNTKGDFHLNYHFDHYSYFSNNRLMLGYSYPVNLRKNSLSVGARLGVDINAIQYDKLNYENLSGNTVAFKPDMDIGLNYQTSKWHIGLGMNHLFYPTTQKDNITYVERPRAFNFMLAYRVGKDSWYFKPKLLYHLQSFSKTILVLNIGKTNKFEGGFSIQTPATFLLLLGMDIGLNATYHITNNFELALSFERHIWSDAKHLNLMIRYGIK